MKYAGREIDVLRLWGQYVELPSHIESPLPTFLSKVRCPNPAHDTQKRHFQINTKKPLVHCFAHCGISGSYEHALCVILGIYEKHNVSEDDIAQARRFSGFRLFPEEVKAAKARVERAHREARRLIFRTSRTALTRESGSDGVGIRKIDAGGERGTSNAVEEDRIALEGGAYTWLPRAARDFLDRRGIDAPARGKWQIGWDEESERIVIPAYDERGRFRFLIRRRIDGIERAKYLYTDGGRRNSLLFGACFLDRDEVSSRGLVVQEGSLGVIRFHQLGITISTGVLGTGMSMRQSRIIDELDPPRVYLFFDPDPAGAANIDSAARKITKRPLYVCLYPQNKDDLDDMTRKEVLHSIDNAMPFAKFRRKLRSVKLTARRREIVT